MRAGSAGAARRYAGAARVPGSVDACFYVSPERIFPRIRAYAADNHLFLKEH